MYHNQIANCQLLHLIAENYMSFNLNFKLKFTSLLYSVFMNHLDPCDVLLMLSVNQLLLSLNAGNPERGSDYQKSPNEWNLVQRSS